MKILMIGPITTYGGVSTHTKSLILELKSRGNQVIHYNTYGEKKYKVLFLNQFYIFLRKSIFLSLFLLKRHSDADIIHIQSSGPIGGFIPALIGSYLKKHLGFNLIITFHYSGTHDFVKKHTYLFNYVLKLSEAFIVVSEHQRISINEFCSSENTRKVYVIPNGYDPNIFYPIDKLEARRILNLPCDERIIINVANLQEKKGQKYLIYAVNHLITNDFSLKCFIIGDGPLVNTLKNQIRVHSLEDYVILKGWLPVDILVKYLNAADLFVLPSIFESFGMVQIEAMACGKPIIATINGGSEGIVISEDYGYLCSPKDHFGLAKNIKKGFESKWDIDLILNYSDQFKWDIICNELIELYNRLDNSYKKVIRK